MGKCYLCQKRKGTIPLNVLGQLICVRCNQKVQEILRRYNENARDIFIVSGGNLSVLKAIPDMLQITKWRTELRKLVFEFISEETLSRHPTKYNPRNINSIRKSINKLRSLHGI
jgi:hypothetical protein